MKKAGGRLNVAHVPQGNATGETIVPTAKLCAAGAPLTLGADNMHTDIVEVVRWALAMACVPEGKVSDAWQPQDVLRLATIEGCSRDGPRVRGRLAGSRQESRSRGLRLLPLAPQPGGQPGKDAGTDRAGRDVKMGMMDGRCVVANGNVV